MPLFRWSIFLFNLAFSKYTVGAVVGAFFSAVGAYTFNLPKPNVVIWSSKIVSAVPDFVGDEMPVRLPDEIQSQEIFNDWTPVFNNDEYPRNPTFSKLRDHVVSNVSLLDHVLSNKEKFTQSKDRLYRLIESANSPRDVEEFYNAWVDNQQLINATIQGEFSRGSFKIPGNYIELGELRQEGDFVERDPLYRDYPTFSDGFDLCRVNLRNSVRAFFLYPVELKARGLDDVDLNRFLCFAVSSVDGEALKAIVDHISAKANENDSETALQSAYRKFLRENSFVALVVTFSNDGRDPISFSPVAKVSVQTDGVGGMPDPLEFDVYHYDSSGAVAPISVSGGNSVSATMYSSVPISRLSGDADRLIQIFEETDKEARYHIGARPVFQVSRDFPFFARAMGAVEGSFSIGSSK